MRQLPPTLSSKIGQNIQTIGNNSDPKLQIAISRAKNAVYDSSYWTVETIRETSGLGDISVAPRRFKPYGDPNRLYEIHVRDGQVYTSIREYPDRLREGFKTQFTLGPGSSVAIAFNGYWQRYRKLWRLITEEKPWIFWVDNSNVLWAQLWDDVDSKRQLDIGVTRVKAIRGWKNVNLADKDQGIVVGYIKMDGSVWYRGYCQQADNSYIWENARQLTQFTSIANSLNLFITNDYRMGFIIETNDSKIHWLITPRNWAGMALERDKFNVNASTKIEFIPINYHSKYDIEKFNCTASANIAFLFGNTNNEITQIGNIENQEGNWGWIVRFKIKNKSSTFPNIRLTDVSTNIPIETTEMVESSPQVYDIIISNVIESGLNNIEGDIKLQVTGLINEAGYNYIDLEQIFTPVNLIPVALPLPEVEVIWNE